MGLFNSSENRTFHGPWQGYRLLYHPRMATIVVRTTHPEGR